MVCKSFENTIVYFRCLFLATDPLRVEVVNSSLITMEHYDSIRVLFDIHINVRDIHTHTHYRVYIIYFLLL